MFGCEQPGWFRVVLAVAPAVLQEGLARIERALAEMPSRTKEEKQNNIEYGAMLKDFLVTGPFGVID